MKLGYLRWRGKCSYCGCALPSVEHPLVVWVASWDGSGMDPVCEACRERRKLRALKRTLPDPSLWQPSGDVACHFCGISLPSADTAPAIIWVWIGTGLVGVCNACRLEHDVSTELTTVPPHGQQA